MSCSICFLNQSIVILQRYVKLQLHWYEYFIFQFFEETACVERNDNIDILWRIASRILSCQKLASFFESSCVLALAIAVLLSNEDTKITD